MDREAAVPKGGQGTRLAFEDRFQYHEWTFKQACIRLSSSVLFYNITLSHRFSFRTLRRPSIGHGSDVFPLDPRSVFSPYCTAKCHAKLCTILNILINRVILVSAAKNKFHLSIVMCHVYAMCVKIDRIEL